MSNNFCKKWENERKSGFKAYYRKHFVGIFIIYIVMIAADFFANNEFSILFCLVALVISLMFPVVAWEINEIRYGHHSLK